LIDKYKRAAIPEKQEHGAQYELYLKLIEAKFGAMPIAVSRIRASVAIQRMARPFADKPRKADYIWQTSPGCSATPKTTAGSRPTL